MTLKSPLLALGLLICLGWFVRPANAANPAAQTTPVSVSIVSLLAHPAEYDGKEVEVVGYFVDESEFRGIFLTKEDEFT